jgi:putative membrane protein
LSAQQFRWLNEFPTIVLVVVVLLAVFKNDIPRDATGYIVVAMIIAFAASIQLYARKRRLAREQAEKEALQSNSTSEAGA